jgi:methyl-accepting chemotaxis protein
MRRWFANLSTRSKLTVGFGVVIACFLVALITAFFALQAVRDTEHSVVEMTEFRSKMNGQRASLFSALLSPAGPMRTERIQDALTFSAEGEVSMRQLQARYQNDPQFRKPMKEFVALRDEFIRVRDKEIRPLIEKAKTEPDQTVDKAEQEKIEEENIAKAKTLMLGAQEDRYFKIRTLAREFTRSFNERSADQRLWAKTIFGILGGLALVAAVIMIASLTHLIARPLEKLTEMAEKIGHGDLRVELIETARTDEMGMLVQAFNRMNQSFQSVAACARQIAAGDLTKRMQPQSERDSLGIAFATMTDHLAGITRELLEAVNVLVASSNEIMTSTTQLASTAAETATAVTETTTTVEEVKQTSQVSSQKAKQVSDQAQKAADISRTGKQAIKQTIDGMNGMRQQMRAVAESILGLSTQGQAIGEIIATVDDLAAQSKLLAVNASIEASKAGEGGKGFAVVALEVRKLAEQSKQATTQVRTILNDIQKATSSAVLATEVATKSVEAGVKQSTAAGDSIGALADNVNEAVQAATQIATTSNQQYIGMDQVVTAMESIKVASTQTVTSTKQAEVAAQQLHTLGQKLKQLVERFKI